MTLPDGERAHLDRIKITDYLLSQSHLDGRTKEQFFMRSGGFAVRCTIDGPMCTPGA